MVTISCDVCKKKMEGEVSEKDFFYYANFSVCESCKDGIEYQMKSTVRGKEPFAFDWYDKVVRDSFGKAVQKGKV
ncbi:MAG: hypothetical protein FWC01_00255 [Treponema sp.]|nr:hypothetical protein [Treponema sp.]